MKDLLLVSVFSTDNDLVSQAAGCRFKAHTSAADPALLVIATEFNGA